MHKVVISGYYGFNNIGDESILRAVVDNLRRKLNPIDITVLSQMPELTSEKFGVHSVYRMDVLKVIKAIGSSDLLISGGGSLLQDATSKKSISYYLGVIWIALLLKKKVFIYSQGIGPISGKINRFLVKKTLNKIKYIVVRDEQSKELLCEIGVNYENIYVTADPVIRVKKAELETGMKILESEGFVKDTSKITVGFALRGLKIKGNFIDEICEAAEHILSHYNAQIVFIPFHYNEDMGVINEIKKKHGDKAFYIENKYLTEEMLSIIGNMDVLIGVRLHSLIYAAIMDVPMIAISYDPKINSFMHSLEMKALCSIYDFQSEFLIEEFNEVLKRSEAIRTKVQKNIEQLILTLNKNEILIQELLGIGEDDR
ncbi:MAG: polysaccharide pyruvyl transferase CsaB [Clostridiales bacterium]|nr:polysaccharide pyruvyl transferase CsaB [Clostridiales bacterium]